jgi:signal transduction histidine kinase
MKHDRKNPLNNRILKAFILQVVLISGTAVSGIYLAEFAIQELLIDSALEREADYFWARKTIESSTPAPNTNTLIGYLFDTAEVAIPTEFSDLSLGIHAISTPVGRSVVHVSENLNSKLFLVFDANSVTEAASYFGLFPLVLMLIVLYSSAWFAYGITRRAVSPVIKLARSVRGIELDKPGTKRFVDVYESRSVDAEIATLATALQHLLLRVEQSIARERTFTREASHELRSPLTVIRMASDNLIKRNDLQASAVTLIERIQRAAKDMEELTEILLLLAREYEEALIKEDVFVNDVVRRELNDCRVIYGTKDLEITLQEVERLVINASERAVAIVCGNLFRNACLYTEQGEVSVTVGIDYVLISDSGEGMTSQDVDDAFNADYNPVNAQGNGIGLSLVKRITDRFGWTIVVESERSKGTRIKLIFPEKRILDN